ncbi:hypothetical protein [Saccharopolyspora sp. NPDC002376]
MTGPDTGYVPPTHAPPAEGDWYEPTGEDYQAVNATYSSTPDTGLRESAENNHSDCPGLRRLVRETVEAAHKRGDDLDGQTDAVMAVIRVTMSLQLAAVRASSGLLAAKR